MCLYALMDARRLCARMCALLVILFAFVVVAVCCVCVYFATSQTLILRNLIIAN